MIDGKNGKDLGMMIAGHSLQTGFSVCSWTSVGRLCAFSSVLGGGSVTEAQRLHTPR